MPIAITNKQSALNSTLYTMNSYTGNIRTLQENAKFGGFFTLDTDSDGIIRRFPLLMKYKNEIYPSLPLQTYLLYNLIEKIKIHTEMIGEENNISGVELIPGTVVRTDGRGQVIIPYRGYAGSFPYISSTDILNNKINKKQLENKIVLIGMIYFY